MEKIMLRPFVFQICDYASHPEKLARTIHKYCRTLAGSHAIITTIYE